MGEYWAVAEKHLDCHDRDLYEKLLPRFPGYSAAGELPVCVFGALKNIAHRGGYDLTLDHQVEVSLPQPDFMRFAAKFE